MNNPLSRMPSTSNSGLNQNSPHLMNSQLLQQNQPKNNINQFPNQQQQQQPNMGTNLNNMINATTTLNNSNNFMNIAGLNNGSNASIAINNLMNNNTNSNQVATPQIQHQLIESFRLAVQAGLISADLLNTKLPQDVLSLLYQLFQTLNQYMNSNQKLSNLNKRRTQMPAQQFKIEVDMINTELLSYKESLVGLQTKINSAHLQLKQMQNNNTSGSTNSSPNNNTEASINTLASAAAAAGVPLSDLPLIKDSTANGNQIQNAAQRSKLLELLNDNNSNRPKLSNSLNSNNQNSSTQFNRQSSLQPQTLHSQQKQTQLPNQNQNQNSLFSNYQSSQWSNFKMNENISPFSGNNGSDNSIIDDRITPFIPGQLWAGHGQSSIEDDPNCTPGSVSKPLLTETIDPESILSSLQRGNQWSNGVNLGGISDLSNTILGNNLNNNNNNNNNINNQINSSSNNGGSNRSNAVGNQQRLATNWSNPNTGIL
jgi:hypothetical protein